MPAGEAPAERRKQLRNRSVAASRLAVFLLRMIAVSALGYFKLKAAFKGNESDEVPTKATNSPASEVHFPALSS